MNKFSWLIRRELWESRAVWIAPAICAAIMIGGVLIAALFHGAVMIDDENMVPKLATLTQAQAASVTSLAHGAMAMPFFILVMFTQFFYALDALYGDRRDRSILFWKSLPVSDTEAVLAKLTVAAVVFPLVALAAAFLTQIVVFVIAAVKLSAIPVLTAQLWSPLGWGGAIVFLSYALLASILWYLPLLGWTLLASAWAPRSPFMWAALPPLGLVLLEAIVLRTHYVSHAIGARVGNAVFQSRAFGTGNGSDFTIAVGASRGTFPDVNSLTELMRPAQFFSDPALWTGLVATALFIVAAVWVRRYRDASS